MEHSSIPGTSSAAPLSALNAPSQRVENPPPTFPRALRRFSALTGSLPVADMFLLSYAVLLHA